MRNLLVLVFLLISFNTIAQGTKYQVISIETKDNLKRVVVLRTQNRVIDTAVVNFNFESKALLDQSDELATDGFKSMFFSFYVILFFKDKNNVIMTRHSEYNKYYELLNFAADKAGLKIKY